MMVPSGCKTFVLCCEPRRVGQLTAADRRGLTPMFRSNVEPYGEVRLDMDRRLRIS